MKIFRLVLIVLFFLNIVLTWLLLNLEIKFGLYSDKASDIVGTGLKIMNLVDISFFILIVTFVLLLIINAKIKKKYTSA